MPSEDAPFGASPIGPSRRQVLAGAGVLATASVAELVPLGDVDGWTPEGDTWPLARYDLANTASTDATPPADPSVAWSDDALGRQERTALVVGPERVYGGGEGLVARSRADGSEVWTHEERPSGRLALHDGVLYSAVAEEIAGLDFDVSAVDPATGERDWGAPLPFEATSLHVADGGVFVGYDGGAAGFDADTGRRRWRSEDGSASGTYLALDGGDLYAADGLGPVTRFAGRDLLDLPLRSGPSLRWESGPPATEAVGPPVVTGDRVIAGQRVHGGPGAVACHPGSGSVVWTAAAGETDRAIRATGLAVADGVAVVGLLYGRPRDVERGTVVGLDVEDGSLRWTASLGDRYPITVTVADDLALMGLASVGPVTDPVRAVDLDSGAERWRVALPDEVTAIAPVEGTTFVACRDGSIHALRD